MKPECKHCKWWDVLSESAWEEDWQEGRGECLLTSTINARFEPDPAKRRAVAYAGFTRDASLVTAPDFGCVQFELNNVDTD